MKICAAQIGPESGDVDANLEQHIELIKLAAANELQFIFFPELSLTGYETKEARQFASAVYPNHLDSLQKYSDETDMCIGVGAPTINGPDTRISMLIFQPGVHRIQYDKQMLHEDEMPYFTAGNKSVFLQRSGEKLTPAICYESMQEDHNQCALDNLASVYLASVAKHEAGMATAMNYFSRLANKSGMNILLSNSHGPCDSFMSCGQSTVWDKEGKLLGKLPADSNGLIGMDTNTQQLIISHAH